jgi:hypothetical protein
MASPVTGPTLSIEGQIVSIDEGNKAKRLVIGFGSGESEVRTLTQVYEVTSEDGHHLVEDFYTTVKSSKKPGFGPFARMGAAARSCSGPGIITLPTSSLPRSRSTTPIRTAMGLPPIITPTLAPMVGAPQCMDRTGAPGRQRTIIRLPARTRGARRSMGRTGALGPWPPITPGPARTVGPSRPTAQRGATRMPGGTTPAPAPRPQRTSSIMRMRNGVTQWSRAETKLPRWATILTTKGL